MAVICRALTCMVVSALIRSLLTLIRSILTVICRAIICTDFAWARWTRKPRYYSYSAALFLSTNSYDIVAVTELAH